ncbi:MAG TPA: SDR family oxidoreductase [Leptospiraceae bacterium]|nr:SDR family oxidoreductase [Leptospiraceae bacterium]HNF17010.1 SDR family oxidoreductase [Leptospiraceae bacterium]HNF27113.1 SDR family oxidoreductase [Leptospiraceae bacterium]HNH08405.1 SDR family oxidoreductase [Leptospiraceae bacterium]HNI27125.1 SDR family oxidoreductase [Leptospiraceae bacterium]
MNILLLGASGFIGNAIFNSLSSEHKVTAGGRRKLDGMKFWKYADFSVRTDWDEILQGIDLVINAVGIVEGDFRRIQTETPLELYESCIRKKIRIIHISAIGAEKEKPVSEFLSTKKETDSFLLNYENARIIYPGIVLGKNGKSSQFFAEVASLPAVPVLSDEKMPFIHISQLVILVEEVIKNFIEYPKQIFALSEPEEIQEIYNAMRGRKALFFKIPSFLMNVFFFLFPSARIGIFQKDLFKIMQTVNADDYIKKDNINLAEEDGKIKPSGTVVFPSVSGQLQSSEITASDSLSYAVSLLSVSFIWIWSAVSSLVSWDVSYQLMKETGAGHDLSAASIWAGSIADLVMGYLVFIKKYRKRILLLQILLVLTYTAILTVFASHHWFHPFGTVAKNIPLLALSLHLYLRVR